MKTIVAFLLAGLASLQAGEFINLDFNSPDLSGTLVPIPPAGRFRGAAAQLIPGWTVTADGSKVSDATYSLMGFGAGSTVVSLIEPRAGDGFDKDYLLLSSNPKNDGKPGPDIWLSQTGTIPRDAVGLWVIASAGIQGFVDGKQIGAVDPNSSARTIWDVTAYQGKEVTLQIRSPSNWDSEFDIVGFTTVPEPSMIGMLALGLGLIGWRAWRRR